MRMTTRPRRLVAALLLVVAGAIHLQLFFDGYATDDIARMFQLQAIASGIVGLYLIATSDELAELFGAAVAGATLGAFALSRVGDGILGFRERGLAPSPQALASVVTAAVALALMAPPAIATVRQLAHQARRPSTPRPP